VWLCELERPSGVGERKFFSRVEQLFWVNKMRSVLFAILILIMIWVFRRMLREPIFVIRRRKDHGIDGMNGPDKVDRCIELLGLKPGASPEEMNQAYRDLVNVWHPDRFGDNERLRRKAEEKLKDINAAYEYIRSYYRLK
jgi:preprotein translocase subunit Sec63